MAKYNAYETLLRTTFESMQVAR